MLSHARRKNIAAEFRQIDATQLPFLEEYDAAVISLALHEMPPQVREEVWAAMHRAVRPTGQLIAVDFAVPLRDNFIGNLASRLTEQDERSTLSYHPAHYENFTEFMHNGGLLGWMQRRGQTVDTEHRYWGGALAVVVVS